ncbi:MAG: hypothetical protein JNL02_06835 [Saprospiraceae bacterium]|nr:hypothetical protein [Saprospiraceae bacterium]
MAEMEDQVMVYDDVCPLCKAYTAGFVRFGWLQHRGGFSEVSPEILSRIDLDRARHEIPLHDTRTGTTLYGLDALFLILGNRFPVFRPLFRFGPFRAVVRQLYQIITYNRRIIAGSRPPAQGFDCAPDFNLFYRWLYIGLAFAGSSAILLPQALSGSGLVLATTGIHSALLAGILFAKRKMDFLGHWATLMLANALLISLLPTHPVAQVFALAVSLGMWINRRKLLFG